MNKWIIAIMASLAAGMEILDASAVNIALPHMQGGLSAGVDEVAWVLEHAAPDVLVHGEDVASTIDALERNGVSCPLLALDDAGPRGYEPRRNASRVQVDLPVAASRMPCRTESRLAPFST